mgnify:CR=1 FL=1
MVFPGNALSSVVVGKGFEGSLSIGTFTFFGASPFSFANLSFSACTFASEKGAVGSTLRI